MARVTTKGKELVLTVYSSEDAYAPMFLQTVIMTLIGTILCAIILAVAPGLA